jgi:type VI secretion system protein ImpG
VKAVTDELLTYYQHELMYLHRLGAEFGEKYPQHASQLMVESGRYQDPHVERLLEGFAFLAARIHRKIDDDFPEITEALFNTIYPHFVRPIPSMSVVEFRVDPRRRKLTSAFNVPRHSVLLSTPPLDGFRCKFRTCYDTVISPCRIHEAQWRAPERLEPPVSSPDAAGACRLLLACDPDVTFASLRADSLRFYLDGASSLVNSLYELLMNNCLGIVIRNPDNPAGASLRLPASALRPMGFSEGEAMLEYSRKSFSGYQLLQEYFAFPEKFFFIELGGLGSLVEKGFSSRAEIIFLISRYERSERHHTLEQGVTPATFRLNCAPVINLFSLTAEPIHIDQTRYEYPVIADRRRRNAYEVFSIDQVSSVNAGSQQVIEFEPLYASHYRRSRDSGAFWQAHRRPSTRENDQGTEMWISLSDLNGRAARPGVETLTVRCSATNRDLVSLPSFDSVEFEMEGASPVSRIVPIRKPTATLRPPLGKGQLWRLVSHLSLNYLSLVERREALQNILSQYNFAKHTHVERQIAGILALKGKRHFARVVSENGISFARGTRVEMELDETHFAEGGAYLFGAVLEYFLGQYTTLNSFSQLVIRTRQRKDALREWAPRAGHKVLL